MASTQKILIAPSVLSADFGRLAEEAQAVERAGADWLHVDVMDGHFVPNLTMGPGVVRALKRAVKIPLDCHLMIDNPEDYVEHFAKAGAYSITVHAEATKDLPGLVYQVRDLGVKVGVSVKPKSGIEFIQDILDRIDMVLIMTVEPGFGGQAFMQEMLPKIKELKKIWPRGLIEVDGGVDQKTAPLVKEAGASVLVAGTAIFGAKDRKQAIAALRGNGRGV